ncbi:glyoxalase [Sphaerisporangium krabiense]|uniref:Putative enzyme related to lactoylglutathione lyase n=1 Tax=Sphaerisporangium krabiense TaxID=763782 RepID=A0A7W8Z657_9ACTN|nr:VOC family protein [Sphaerisporangium krabiense]MBB5628054.1 putative enzyme related to lactoylglutathione lyase [Sphaerisporangium krabiense]GII62219.1 glyoxalase [Sphaerisporangium krabiense]
MLRGLTTVSFFADDVAAAARWYAGLLGIEPYFTRHAEGRLAYAEFRVGDHEDELGIVDSRFLPHPPAKEAGGAVVYWHVDDLEGAFARLLSLGATEHQRPIERGPGFVTASVVDPFGNILGVMYNAHYLQVLASDL